MIVSSFPGRIRYRSQSVFNLAWQEKIGSLLAREEGIISFHINSKSGSMVIDYKEDIISEKRIRWLLNQILARSERLTRSERVRKTDSSHLVLLEKSDKNPIAISRRSSNYRKAFYGGMGLFLLISLLAIGLGRKKLHTQAGVAFVGLVGKHILDYGNRIWR